MERDIAVEVQDLRRTFDDFVAVNDISFQVRTGEIFGFLGPNGAGKSTTIRMLCGLLLPSGGKGTVSGYDILTETEELKKHIGYMSQKFSLYDDLTVEENINFFSGVYRVPKQIRGERKAWVLDMADLQDKKHTLPATLPTGFKQRLALGCAILHDPAILFLDEPTSGVDPIARRDFWDLIDTMAEEGKTVFVTTHYMDEADYCDRLSLLYQGEIIAEGTPTELRESYMQQHVVELEVDNLIAALDVLEQHEYETAIFGNTLHLTLDSPDEQIPKIRELLESEHISVNKSDPFELILGKTIPFALVGFGQLIFVTFLGVFWFDVPMKGSIGTLALGTAVYLVTILGLGLFISTVSQTQQQALMATMFFLMPSILLSGFVFPIESMPRFFQYITYLNPLRYFLVIIRGIFLKGSGLAILWPQILALLGLSSVITIGSASRFQKRIK